MRIYLAGPEVFLPDAITIGREKCRLCSAYGFEGVFPLDASLDLSGLTKVEQATRISLANEGLMRSCDVLIANLTPFRGVSMDSGTAFEVGFMRALGRPVLGYSNTRASYKQRADVYRAGPPTNGDCDRPEISVEDFDLPENLMIAVAIRDSGFEIAHAGPSSDGTMQSLDAFKTCLAAAAKALIPS